MTSFPSPLSAPEKATLRTSGYWSRVLACLNPPEVVFRAQAAESITSDPFITFDWENADVGAYGDVWEGMVCYISATTSLREAKYRGRVRLAPSSTEFYISKNGTILNEGDYIIVVRDTDLSERSRNDTLIDGSVVYHDLPPMTKGLPFAVVLYDAANAGTVSWTSAQTGIAVDAAASSVDVWSWDVSGAGASSIDDDAAQNPTFTFEAGYHYLVRVRYEDDNAISNYQIIHVYAVTRTFDAPVVQPILTGSITGDLENGWSASLTAYGDVADLLDRTHCTIFHVQHFGDNSSTPIITNVLMNGRIRSSTIQTEGSAEAGRLQQVSFAVEGIVAYLRRMRLPNDIVRPTNTPNEWGEIAEPNPWRMAVYSLWAYTTLTNLGSFGVEAGEFSAWQIGGEPRAIDGGLAIDVLVSLLDPIKAYPNVSPDGELYLARTVSYLEDRDDVDLITTFELQDLRDYGIEEDSSRTVSQVIAYGGSFDTTAGVFVLYTAQSPSIVYGDGGETRELTREILAADSDTTDARAELSARASNEYGFENPKPLLKLVLFDSYAGVMRPTNYQRYAAVLPASSNTLNRAWGETDYWQLQSVSLTINTDGTIDVTPELPAETSFSDAQVLADLLPDNLSNQNPVLPVLPNDPAFPTDPLELYPNECPAVEDLQAIDPYSASQSMTPMPPNVAAQMAVNQGKPNSKTLRILFSQETNTTSTWLTVNTAPYLLTVSGSAKISLNATTVTAFAATDAPGNNSGLSAISGETITINAPTGTWCYGVEMPGSEYFCNDADGDATNAGGLLPPPHTGAPLPNIYLGRLIARVGTSGTWTDIGVSGEFVAGSSDTIYTMMNDIAGSYGDNSGSLSVHISNSNNSKHGDAFYRWDEDAAGTRTNIELYPTGEGLFIDNTKYAAIPPYSPSNRYENLPFTGTGNVINARMEFADYSGVQDVYLYVDVERQA